MVPDRIARLTMRVTISRNEAPGHRWLLATRDAAPAVRPIVPHYVGYEEWCTTPVRRLEVPHPNITLIINLGSRLTIRAPALQATAAQYTSFSAGLYDTVVATESHGMAAGIELNLSPLGMWQLLGLRMAELHNRVVALDDLIGAEAHALEERLRNTADWETRFDLLDAALGARLHERQPAREMAWAWAQLATSPARCSVSAIAAQLQWSRRRLADEFREYIGMTPKTVARVMRFDRAVRVLRAGGAPALSMLAHDCGYADQAHLTREFREFSGLSPTAFMRQLGPAGLRCD